MVHSHSVDRTSDRYLKCDVKCKRKATNQCHGCGKIHCSDHYLEHHNKLKDHFKYVIHTRDLLSQELKLLTSQLSTNVTLDLVKQIYKLQMESTKN
ncbi:unnamed protein product [Didymodactylos carnosus]|uniref:Uncharacterized protein n=1 Tax=Didymodactylos carnosus TaxID=1234261 RepID=A0A815IWH6_9BILA|nr:unnamed protein product [Didymodactylos carnosus]CAF1537221.1 unnamed protein product [Didymodactylos carnosus]CAF4255969.1 unnamed protein product [Didymodactylos carnosus]CAF4324956.1 unnamed protein product [Didymodactylos carnosus]